LYSLDNDTVFVNHGNYIELEVKKNEIQLFFPQKYEYFATDYVDTNSMIVDSILLEKYLISDFYWKKEKDKLLYRKRKNNNKTDSLLFIIGDSTQIQDIPFYFLPYKNYYQIFKMGKEYSNGQIYAKYLGVEEISLENRESKVKVHKFQFDYLNFNFSEIKPDYMYFDYKSYQPIRLEFNSVEFINSDKINVIKMKIELTRQKMYAPIR
jgi:hypothetical protein